MFKKFIENRNACPKEYRKDYKKMIINGIHCTLLTFAFTWFLMFLFVVAS